MNKKTIKTVAAATVFAFGVSVIPAPAYAVPTNIVAATEGKNTLTLTEIQELAVIYNDTVDSLELSIKQLENQEMMTRNQKRDVENELDYLYYTDTGSDQLADMKEQIDGLKLLADANPTDMALQASYAALSGQYQSALASQKSAAQQLDNAFDQAISGINQLDDALDQMAEGKEDLQDAIEDLAHIMRYTSSQLALSIVQLTD